MLVGTSARRWAASLAGRRLITVIKTSMPIQYTGPVFWQIPPGTSVIGWIYPPALCQEMIDAILDGMRKAMATGVVEYRIGSRSLRRFTIRELQDLLGFWTNMLEAAIYGGSIIARRGCPTDT
jgi:hypothetical protein